MLVGHCKAYKLRCLTDSKHLDSATLLASDWWPQVLTCAIDEVKRNQQLELSAKPTMPCHGEYSCRNALLLVEMAAAIEQQHHKDQIRDPTDQGCVCVCYSL